MGGNKAAGGSGANDHAISIKREELARKLRRVASAPNAQGLFSSSKSKGEKDTNPSMTISPPLATSYGERPRTGTVLSVEEAVADENDGLGALDDGPSAAGGLSGGHLFPVPPMLNGARISKPGQIRETVAFRRTYSSNSIKVRNVEVGPGSFDKIKLIGKGDVGKVYLVREKKSSRLYAMKGERNCLVKEVRVNDRHG